MKKIYRALLRLVPVMVLSTPLSSTPFANDQEPTQNPEAADLLKQGQQALEAKHFVDAEKAFKKAAKLERDNCASCYIGLARARNALGATGAALNSCDRALTAALDDHQRAEIRELRGDILLQMREPKSLKEAEAEYRGALQLDPDYPVFHLKLAVALFKQSRDPEGQQEVASYLQLSPTGAYASYAKRLAANPRRAREEFAPEFQVTTLQGQTVSLSELGGRIVVLDFWATWCPPCRESVPELKEMTKKYPPDKLVLLSVSADEDEQKWREFVAKKNMDWAQYWDKDGKMRKLMNVNAFPTYLVIDPEGVIRERIVGLNPQESIVHRLKQKLQTMLPQG